MTRDRSTWLALLALFLLSAFIYMLKQWSAGGGKQTALKKAVTVVIGILATFAGVATVLSFFGIGISDVQRQIESLLKTEASKSFVDSATSDDLSDSTNTGALGEIGTSVLFGAFSADDAIPEEEWPVIEWIIIQKDDQTAKLLSKYGLIYMPYESRELATIWQDSSICSWLNGEFYEKALDKTPIVIPTSIYTNSPSFPASKRRSMEHVYLLSSEEVASLLSNETSICKPSVDAMASFKGNDIHKDGDWWYLREEGKAYNFVASVDEVGNLTSGGSLNNGGGILIRPCITISINDFLTVLSTSDTTQS